MVTLNFKHETVHQIMPTATLQQSTLQTNKPIKEALKAAVILQKFMHGRRIYHLSRDIITCSFGVWDNL